MSDTPLLPDGALQLYATFTSVLVLDVDAAISRRSERDTAAHRRELIRTAFAAIDGVTWSYRDHISLVASELGLLEPGERAALDEINYVVATNGRVIAQPRHLVLKSALRLTARIASRIVPTLGNPFEQAGWHAFQTALKIRHRVTHPKSVADLSINEDDIATALQAFHWAMDIMLTAMEAANVAYRQWVTEMRGMLDALKREDAHALAAYRQLRALGD